MAIVLHISKAFGKELRDHLAKSAGERPPPELLAVMEDCAVKLWQLLQDGADFSTVETSFRDSLMKAGRKALGMAADYMDDGEQSIEIDGKVWYRASEAPKTVTTTLGRITYRRGCYRRRGERRQHCPVDERLQLVDGCMTDAAANLSVYALSQQTPRDAKGLFKRMGAMAPSVSMLQRVMWHVQKELEPVERELQATLVSALDIPAAAVSFVVSLDGVMVNLRPGQGDDSKTGWREACCGTIAFYDADGKRLHTIYYGRMPESGKLTLKRLLTQEVERVRRLRPDLTLVAVADGAVDNWTWLDKLDPDHKAIDYWHACEHLGEAKVYAARPKEWYRRQRGQLLESGGVEKVIRSLRHQRDRAKSATAREVLERVLGYFRKRRHRMRYHDLRQKKLAIGSGVVEAANKTLVTKRMKCSGMRWGMAGGQAVLTFRALEKSGRFDAAWDLLRSRANRNRPSERRQATAT